MPYGPNIDPSVGEAIQRSLTEIERAHDVRVIFAVESGSRAWGFPSPDSDYDVRFVYARRQDWYLSLFPGRDVIELPIVGELDVNGWDIRKALGLLLKPNPVLLEWLSSPIRYRWDDGVCDQLQTLATKVTHGPACLYHYRHLAQRQWNTYIEGKDAVSLKKYFYVVRPALAIRWLRLRQDSAPPMNFQQLVAATEVSADVRACLDDLLISKSRLREMGLGQRLPLIDGLILQELEWAAEADLQPRDRSHALAQEAEALFRSLV